jgi:hypothetical protein
LIQAMCCACLQARVASSAARSIGASHTLPTAELISHAAVLSTSETVLGESVALAIATPGLWLAAVSRAAGGILPSLTPPVPTLEGAVLGAARVALDWLAADAIAALGPAVGAAGCKVLLGGLADPVAADGGESMRLEGTQQHPMKVRT